MPTSSTTTTTDRRKTAGARRLLFFGGKGGVGKTTCAAARAIAEARRGRRVLLLSTDPAHSLGDALRVRLSARPSRIRARGMRGELSALELNGPRAFARWLSANRHALTDVLEHGTWLDRADINTLLQLSIPGVDELMALVEIARLAGPAPRRSRFDLVVVDTAPTGHTLRLLAAPDTVTAVASILDSLQEEHRLIRARFGRIGRPEAADRLIETIAAQAREAGALMQDQERSAFHLVTLPEALSAAETAEALATLERARIAVATLVVNRVLPAGAPCPLCDHRRAAEKSALAGIRHLAGARPLVVIQARVAEPRGVSALAAIGDELSPLRIRSVRPSQPASLGRRATRGSDAVSRIVPAEDIAGIAGRRLLMFGGKGGVGKTTCSAAVAIRIAETDPSRRVLLLSTDPAHSLGHVLNAQLGDEARRIAGGPANLEARELDAPRALAAHRDAIEAAIAEVTASTDAASVRGATDIVDLAPPGIDELLGILSVVESLGLDDAPPLAGSRPSVAAAYDLVVCDTAPTGHALRLLEMPEAAREWVQALLRVLLKYRDVVRPGRLAQELVALSHSIRRLGRLLHDPRQCGFVAVTRAADLPRLETERLLTRVHTLQIAVPTMIVNAATLAPGGCRWCTAVYAAERKALAALAEAARCQSRRCVIILTPLVAPPPRGIGPLRSWGGRWTPA